MFDRLWGRRRDRLVLSPPLSTHQLWLVSLSAPVNRGPEASRTALYPFRYADDARAQRWLREQWEIADRAELLSRLEGLLTDGYRAPLAERFRIEPIAWDVALYTDVVRKGFAAGYLDEPTAWRLLRATVPPTTAAYDSWRAFADDYLLVRLVWMNGLRSTRDADFPAPQAVSDAHLRTLLDPANTQSPWNQAPWEVITRPDRPR
ncbi:DUF1266 domain-containing protein [Streptomyces albus subsp. chlorinus]|uniref:DUF1266 domain-containing protein n=1 Tax=Streptomyces albus TaxID=1888 RepID=UPI001570679A|nr:DUF1266 domain-containing protein [Streptomyces albus]NSC24673.1 DUF1266 domain-containing protein [Streptomyces albus subsp. chlorinus]